MVGVLSPCLRNSRQDRAARCATDARDLVGDPRARRGPGARAEVAKETAVAFGACGRSTALLREALRRAMASERASRRARRATSSS
jgi:hypothetical protein